MTPISTPEVRRLAEESARLSQERRTVARERRGPWPTRLRDWLWAALAVLIAIGASWLIVWAFA